jgi:hypothetical protein
MAVDNQLDTMLSGLEGDIGESETGNEDSQNDDAEQGDPLEGKESLQQELIKLYAKCKGEDRYSRLVEVKDVKQQEFYWTGRQYLWWSSEDQRWNLPTQQAANYGDLNLEDMPRFEFVTNIYQAKGLMVVGAVAGAPPRIRFFPEDADDENDIETAEGRTKLAKLIERWNPIQKMLQQEVYHAYNSGFICAWTRYVANGEKYGIDSVQLLQQGAQEVNETILCPQCGWSAPANEAEPPVPCPQCGTELTEDNITQEEAIPVPEEGETQNIPRGRQVISIFGALNCCRPQHASEQSEFHYFGIEDEIHYAPLRAAFEDVAEKIKPGLNQGADDIFERNARLSVAENTKLLTQSGANQANLCTFVRCWFRPTAFWIIDDEDVRNELLETFPRGARVEFTGNVYCKSEAESMDDAIVTTHAMPGRGQHRPSIGGSMLSVQDRVNTFSNIEAETYEYGIPITYRAADTWDAQANDEQRAAPGLEVEVALRQGENIQQRIMQLRADSVSPDMYQHTNELIGAISDTLVGTYPAVSGAGGEQGAPDTLGQQVMQRDQAMGRMGIFYVNLKQLHADVMTLSCRCFEAHTDGEVKIPVLGPSGDFESESVDVSALEGEAEAYPEGDENFPELWNQQRATMMQIMDTPYGQQLAQDPENAELFAKMTGICSLKIPGVDARRKQLKEIAELIKIPQGDEILSGLAPMVEVDPVTDDNPVEAATCKWWLNSSKGQKTKRENPMGWQAVKQHMQQHMQAIPKPEPPSKPLSESITMALKDMPPEAQAQVLGKYGIEVKPQDFVDQVKLERAKKGVGEPAMTPAPGPAGPAAPPMGETANQPAGGGGM